MSNQRTAARGQTAAVMLFTNRARELAEFCVRHGGKAFAGWPVTKLFAYVFFHVVARTVFVARKGGNILAVAFAWSNPETEIRKRAAAGAPQFDWRRTDDEADSLFLAQVIAIGTRAEGQRGKAAEGNLLQRLAQQVTQRWPDHERRKIFTYRRSGADGPLKLVELRHDVIEKLIEEKRGKGENGICPSAPLLLCPSAGEREI